MLNSNQPSVPRRDPWTIIPQLALNIASTRRGDHPGLVSILSAMEHRWLAPV